LKNKVIIITGASSGIGKACAQEFASRGAKVVIAARNMDKLEALANQMQNNGFDVLVVRTDVSILGDCKNLIKNTIDTFGKVDILINNAGISMRANFAETNLEVIKRLMDINFWGTVFCTKYALPYILKAQGSIVGISSIAGYIGLPGRTGYSASKFAMNGFLEALRTENLKTGLHVLIASPGFTATNIRNIALASDGSQQGESPRKETKMMQPEDVAKAIANAIYKRKKNLILTSEGKLIVLLNKIAPSWIAKKIYKNLAKEPGSPF